MDHQAKNRRILVVDDNEAVRDDFRRILAGPSESCSALQELELMIFEELETSGRGDDLGFWVDSCLSGQEALEKCRVACGRGQPYALAFVDMRMPPGWDGFETISRLWETDSELQIVLCTAYSDHTFGDIMGRIGQTHSMLLLKKPFDPIEVRQAALALTEKWNAQRHAHLKMTDLQAMVTARTAALERAHKEAEEASRTKGEFLASMSHEIRTPMTAILGYAELLTDTAKPLAGEEVREALETISRNGRHLLDIINGILDLSKIEAGQLQPELVPVQLGNLLSEIHQIFRVQAAAKSLSLEISCDETLPLVIRSDPTRLRQILINLVGNAIKFTDRGSVELAARRTAGLDAEDHLSFEVIDTGLGLTREQLERLFTPFTQATASTTRRFGGTGLGLALSRRLAELLGGRISVSSEPGKGSTFRLLLPILPAASLSPRIASTEEAQTGSVPAAQPATAELEPSDGSAEQTDPSALDLTSCVAERPSRPDSPSSTDETDGPDSLPPGCRILLVEDGKDNRKLISLLLSKAGADVALAANGQIGVEIAQTARFVGDPFDLVLMDMQMPVLDGYEATRILRSQNYEGPIIALTAHVMGEEEERCREAGCDAYATKPIDRRALLRTITRHLESGHRE